MNYSLEYQGELRSQIEHLKSGTIINTDAPTDNKGKGESFSPTDLLATSLASCMVTIIGIQCDARKWKINSMKAEITKVMASNPRRVEKVGITLKIIGQDLDQNKRDQIRQFAETCPVALSLHPDLNQEIDILFD